MKKLAYSLGGVSLVILLGVYGYPLLRILLMGFCPSAQACSVTIFWTTFKQSYYLERLWFSFYQALLSTGLTLLLAVPGALLMGHFDFKGKIFFRNLFSLPFVMPSILVAIAFLTLVGPKGFLGIDLRNSLTIIVLAHVFYNYGLVLRIVSGYLEGLGGRYLEAGAMLGGSSPRNLLRLTLPLASPAILAAAILVFIFCFSSFGIILLLAPKASFSTLEVEIYRQSSQLLALDKAAALASAQLILLSLFNVAYSYLQKRLSIRLVSTKPKPKPNPWQTVGIGAYFLITGLVVVAPLGALIYKSFSSFDLRAFISLWQPSGRIGISDASAALVNSLVFASLSTVFSLILGLAVSYAISRANWLWLDTVSLLPLSTSAVTLGLGYLLAFPQVLGGFWSIVLAHSLLAFPLVVRSLLASLRAIPLKLLDAGHVLGSSAFKIFYCIEFPLLRASMVSAAALAFSVSLGEFATVLVLSRPEYATLPVAIFERLSRPGEQNYQAALMLSLALLGLSLGVMRGLEPPPNSPHH